MRGRPRSRDHGPTLIVEPGFVRGLDELRRLYARCDPDEPLETGDPRYVDIDHIADGDSRPRRYAWVQRIARKFELASDAPRLLLLTGLPGSGKSTELRRILAKLRDPAGAGLFPALIDANDVMDLSAPLDIPELILAVLVGTERRIMIDLEGVDPASVNDQLAKDSVSARVWSWLTTTEVELGKFDIGAHGQKLTLELKRNPTFKQRVRATVEHRLTDFLAQARRHMAELEARAKRYQITEPTTRYRGVLVAVDGLEKLRGLSSNAQQVLESAEHVFRKLEPRDLGVHAIFTVPAALATRRYLDVECMPVIKIRDKSGNPHGPGVHAMRSLIDCRLSSAEQQSVFGDQSAERVTTMIAQSGGYPRELVKMLQEALNAEQHPLDERAFKVLLGARSDAYCRLVRGDLIERLRQIHADKPRLTIPREQLSTPEAFDSLLMNSLVLLYQNEVEWTDINPAILPMLPE